MDILGGVEMLNNKWAAYFWDNGVFLVLGHIMARAKSTKTAFWEIRVFDYRLGKTKGNMKGMC